jgi:Raf kinase inhibitor-like YbhB/YbcL family protein
MLEKLPDAIGHALQDQRAGLDQILFNRISLREGTAQIELSSLAFKDHAPLPERFTADGEGVSPPLSWKGVPSGTASLALIVEDADSPTPHPLVHAIAVDIDPKRNDLAEGELRETDAAKRSALNLGRNSYLSQAWLPPDPPPGHGLHRYAFQLFALADGVEFSKAPGREELVEAVRERGLASACLIGTYSRDNTVVVDDGAARIPEPIPHRTSPA